MTESSGRWTSQLSFTERFQHITSISSALHEHAQVEKALIQKRAKEIEASHFESAVSLEDYDRLCRESAKVIPDVARDLHSVGSVCQHELELPPTPVALGKYHHALPYRNGIFSEVYKAQSSKQDEQNAGSIQAVALKVTTPSTMVAPHDSVKEARILRFLQGENQVIPLLEDFRLDGDRFVLVFPFMPLSVDKLLADRELDQASARFCLKDLLAAVAFLHSHNIIHRDIKPSNLLLRAVTGPAYLADFGISWSPKESHSEKASDKITDVGTTCYRPPEILFGKRDYDQTLDMWATGCVAAELVDLSTKTLFESGNVGTELALIQSIFMTLGTADENVWPSAAKCPDWGKMQWKHFSGKAWSELLPRASPAGRDLVSSLVRYEWSQRQSAVASLAHPYFNHDA